MGLRPTKSSPTGVTRPRAARPALERFRGRRVAAPSRRDGGRGTRRCRPAQRLHAARLRLAPACRARVAPNSRASRCRMPCSASRGHGRAAKVSQALDSRGADEVTSPPAPILVCLRGRCAKLASGGELSRAMLAIRRIVTLGDDVETLIFDQVDIGIGGDGDSPLGGAWRASPSGAEAGEHHAPAAGGGVRRSARFAIAQKLQPHPRAGSHRDHGAAGRRRGSASP